jgi:hypothetical protein
MIDVKTEDAIATVTMRHGKANALDITLCEALADCFDKLCTRAGASGRQDTNEAVR